MASLGSRILLSELSYFSWPLSPPNSVFRSSHSHSIIFTLRHENVSAVLRIRNTFLIYKLIFIAQLFYKNKSSFEKMFGVHFIYLSHLIYTSFPQSLTSLTSIMRNFENLATSLEINAPLLQGYIEKLSIHLHFTKRMP